MSVWLEADRMSHCAATAEDQGLTVSDVNVKGRSELAKEDEHSDTDNSIRKDPSIKVVLFVS